MRKIVLRWVVGPLILLGLGANWFFTAYRKGLQENCAPHCVTDSDVTAAMILFFIGAATWAVAVYVTRRKRT